MEGKGKTHTSTRLLAPNCPGPSLPSFFCLSPYFLKTPRHAPLYMQEMGTLGDLGLLDQFKTVHKGRQGVEQKGTEELARLLARCEVSRTKQLL